MTPADSRRVRGKVTDHLWEILEQGKLYNITYEETLDMIEKEFGNPKEFGKAIAWAKGKFRTCLKKTTRSLLIALVIALAIRAVAVQAYMVTGDAVSPAIPKGQRLLVNRLTSLFKTNDIVVYTLGDENRVGLVKQVLNDERALRVARQGEENKTVALDNVIGKVFFLYGPVGNETTSVVMQEKSPTP